MGCSREGVKIKGVVTPSVRDCTRRNPMKFAFFVLRGANSLLTVESKVKRDMFTTNCRNVKLFSKLGIQNASFQS